MHKLLRHLLLASVAALLPATAAAFRVDTISVSEPRLLDNPMPALVAVPDAAADTSLRFPTVYLLHGYGGDHTNWLAKQPRIGELADRYGIVVVTPGAGNTWYFDAPGKPGQQVETFFIEALVPYIDANYPTIDSRAKRAISGLSMGGHGALRMATRHPQIFGAAASMSGGVDIRPFENRWGIKDIIGTRQSNPAAWDNATVAGMIPQIKEAGLAILFDCGVDDFFADVNNSLHSAMVEAGIPHDYISRPGNHSWKYWGNSVLYHLLFFNEFFSRQ